MKTKAERFAVLGAAILKRRTALGLTQRQAASKIGCTATTVFNIETGAGGCRYDSTYLAACAWARIKPEVFVHLSTFAHEPRPTCEDAKQGPVVLTSGGEPAGVLISPEVFEALEAEIRAVYLTYGTT